MQNAKDKLAEVLAKLNEQSLRFETETGQSAEQLEDTGPPSGQDRLGPEATSPVTPCPSDAQPAAESSGQADEEGRESADSGDAEAAPQGNQTDDPEGRPEKTGPGGLETVG